MILNDISENMLKEKIVAVDTETNGLDHRIARPLIFTAYGENAGVEIVRLGEKLPTNIKRLLQNSSIQKVVHHAPFDLNMLYYNYKQDLNAGRSEDTLPFTNVICTRIAAKYIDPTKSKLGAHNLVSLVDQYLGYMISKDEQLSDWSQELTESQINYVERDVKYLIPLWRRLEAELVELGEIDKFWIAMSYLPYQIELNCAPIDLNGVYGRI